jgi:hypothetical protein
MDHSTGRLTILLKSGKEYLAKGINYTLTKSKFQARNVAGKKIGLVFMPSVFIKTYGCQMNVRDSEQVARDLASRGYEMVASEDRADVVLLNTCSVRDMAEQKAMGKMQTLEGRKKRRQHQVIGFLGCMAQSRGASILEELPEVDLVIGTQKFHETGRYVDDLFRQRRENPGGRSERVVDVAEESGSQNTIRDHLLAPKQVSSFVSIMQGCNMHCTFCIVPTTRGAERSRPMAEIVGEVESLVGQGVKEVTLLGQIVNLYGRHEFSAVEGRSPFAQLLHAVCAVPGLERVRFTSPHPIGFKDDLRACASAAAVGQRPHPEGDASRLHASRLPAADRKTSCGAAPARLYHGHHRRVSGGDRGGFPGDVRRRARGRVRQRLCLPLLAAPGHSGGDDGGATARVGEDGAEPGAAAPSR